VIVVDGESRPLAVRSWSMARPAALVEFRARARYLRVSQRMGCLTLLEGGGGGWCDVGGALPPFG
jgi:hypothetical protein